MDVTNSDKHSSPLRQGVNYGRKKHSSLLRYGISYGHKNVL